jgi:hypothetical protein
MRLLIQIYYQRSGNELTLRTPNFVSFKGNLSLVESSILSFLVPHLAFETPPNTG